MKTGQENVEDFDWEKDPETLAFFGETLEEITDVIKKPEVKDEENKDDERKEESHKPDEDEENFFNPKTEEPAPTEKVEVTTSSYITELKAKGLIEFELEEGEELTEELAQEILETSLEDKAEARAIEYLKELPEDVQALNKFILKGGTMQEYLSKLNLSGEPDDLDLDDEATQERIVRQSFLKEGYDQEDIDSLVEAMKDSNRLKKVAEAHYQKIKKSQEETKAQLLARQQEQVEEQKKIRKAYKQDISKLISENTVLKSLEISKKDIIELPNYISENTVKVKNGGYISEMQKDLYEALKDKEKVVVLAKLLRDNFEFSTVKAKAKDEVAKTVRDNIRRSSISERKGSPKSLLDIVL